MSFTFADLLPFLYGELVTAVVKFIVSMSLDLMESDIMHCRKAKELLPQIAVGDFRLGAVLPAVPCPFIKPVLLESIDYLSTVTVDIHFAGTL